MFAYKVKIYGIVQGVGFRPTLSRLFKHYRGWVRNSSCCVEIYLETTTKIDINDLILKNKPKNAIIENIYIDCYKIKKFGYKKFIIKYSLEEDTKNITVGPDLGICKNCEKELFDSSNRRFLHPLITCTDCGPRFSIAKDGLFDRKNTTLSNFKMCNDCKVEYSDIVDRRYHAQTISCLNCGPQYFYIKNAHVLSKNIEAIKWAAKDLINGQVGLIKGIGGYHLVCDAQNPLAIENLKKIKHREQKPFAIIAKNIETVKKYCHLSSKELSILTSQKRPILLLKSKAPFENICFSSPYLGVMLPYAPVYMLLFYFSNLELIISTSANLTEFPLIYKEKDAISFKEVDFLLANNRKIVRPIEDSIVQVVANKQLIYRYARGFAPIPFYTNTKPNILAVGSDLKNNIAITKHNKLILSQFTQDLSNCDNYEIFKQKVNDYLKFFDIKNVDLAVCDLHPNYFSSDFVRCNFNNFKEFQHHLAHFASVLLEHNIDKDCLGIILDGTGYGSDGNIWGGEFFVKIDNTFKRVGHIKYLPLKFGDKAIKEPYRIAASYLYEITKDIEFIKNIFGQYSEVVSIIPKLKNFVYTSSAGRLFDAVSAILNIRCINTYEAQSAIELQYESFKYPTRKILEYEIKNNIIDFSQTLLHIAKNNFDKKLSAVFINTFIDAISKNAINIALNYQIKNIALSGGVFQNEIVLKKIFKNLSNHGFNVFFNSSFPINDGNIAVGQVYLANKEVLCV